MKRTIYVFISMLFMVKTAFAQLYVNIDQNVGIATDSTSFAPMLKVGDNSFYESNNINMGIAATTDVTNANNIGLIGSLEANANFSSDKNFGILGIVDNMHSNHGRNYGLCGMVNPASVVAQGVCLVCPPESWPSISPLFCP